MRSIRLLVALSLLAWCSASFALDPAKRFHDYVVDNWNIEHGLPQISVLSIAQDAQGYLWIGTQNGIARFDGVRFVVYDRQSTNGLDTTMAEVAWRDRGGALWFGTPRGALHFDGERFKLWREGQIATPVHDIVELSDGTVLFATSRGLMRAGNDELLSTALLDEPSYGLLLDGDTVWIGGEGHITRWTPQRTTRVNLPDGSASLLVKHLERAGDGLWLGTSGGMFRLRGERIEPAGLSRKLASLSIESLKRDSDDNLWIGTPPALYRLSPARGLERIDAKAFVRNSWVTAVFEDRERNLWLGSMSESLFRLWNGWSTRITTQDGLGDAFVWSIARDPQGRIVLGTNSNVVRLDPQGAREIVAGAALPNPAAYNLYYDRDGRLWIGTRSGLALYDEQGRDISPAAFAELKPLQINTVAQVGEDDYWIGTQGGLYRWRGGLLRAVGATGTTPEARVRSILVYTADHLLLGTEGGIREVDDDRVTTPPWSAALDDNFVSHIGIIAPGLLGITTLDAGLGLMRDEHLIVLTPAQGLPTGNGWSFATVDESIYVSTIEGVYRLAIAKLPDPTQGLPERLEVETVLSPGGRHRGSQRARCCNGGAQSRLLVDGDGIWLPSISGALRLDLSSVAGGDVAPTVQIESLRYGGRSYAPGAAEPLAFGKGPRDVEIDFSAISFRDPMGLRFRYFLEGYDSRWHDADARRAAFYTNLPAGDYGFRVRANSASGIDSKDDATIAFRITPFWYERQSARVLAGAIVLALLIAFIRQRLRRYRERQSALEHVIAERTLELRHANAKLREANRALSEESQTDALTGLRNRRFLFAHIDRALAPTSGAEARAEIAFVLLDLDHFKAVNDRFGHAAGDATLAQFAALLGKLTREHDYVVRWGGEEFLLVLREVAPDSVPSLVEWLRTEVQAHRFGLTDGADISLTCSIGYSMFPPLIDSPRAVPWGVAVELADAALYQVKAQGRNGWAGLMVNTGTDPTELAHGVAGRIAELTSRGLLRWLGVRPRLVPIAEHRG